MLLAFFTRGDPFAHPWMVVDGEHANGELPVMTRLLARLPAS